MNMDQTELTARKQRDAELDAEVTKEWKGILSQIRPKEWGYWTIQEVHDKFLELSRNSFCEVGNGYVVMNGAQMWQRERLNDRYENWLKNHLNKRRVTAGDWNKIEKVFGVWVVCKNGSIDYGSN